VGLALLVGWAAIVVGEGLARFVGVGGGWGFSCLATSGKKILAVSGGKDRPRSGAGGEGEMAVRGWGRGRAGRRGGEPYQPSK